MFDFEDIIKSANMYLAAKDKNLKYLYCSENVASGLGLDSPRQIIGKTDYELFDESIGNIYRAGDIHAIKGGVLLNAREVQPHTDKTIQILTSKNQLKNKKGDPVGIVVSFIDITGLDYKTSSDIFEYNEERKSYEFHISGKSEFFTKREYEVFRHVLLGLVTKQIAKRLMLSPRTIEDYLERIKSKLQCTSKHQIAETAMRLGILHQNII